MPEVRDYEPARALDGGADGLDAYRALVAMLPGLLKPAGAAIFELGVGQLNDVRLLAEAASFTAIWENDLSGHPRALVLRFK
jgi:release factor glutamine methyltransferase